MGADALISGIAGIGSSVASGMLQAGAVSSANDANREIARETREFNAMEAQKAREWSEVMSNTAWQRGVKDMKAAGINPMLAFSQGGASTPSAAYGSAPLTRVDPVPPAISTAVSSALDYLRTMVTVKKDIAEAQNTKADTVLKVLDAPNVQEKTKVLASETLKNLTSARSLGADLVSKENRAVWEKKFPGITGFLDAIKERGATFNSAARSFVPYLP